MLAYETISYEFLPKWKGMHMHIDSHPKMSKAAFKHCYNQSIRLHVRRVNDDKS